MKYKQNVLVTAGHGKFLCQSITLMGSSRWRVEELFLHGATQPQDKPALVELLAPKEDFYFPTTTYFDYTELYFILLIYRFSRSAGRAVTALPQGWAALPRLPASLCSPKPC